MDKFIAHANIAHLREKLATEQDETKRQMLLRLRRFCLKPSIQFCLDFTSIDFSGATV